MFETIIYETRLWGRGSDMYPNVKYPDSKSLGLAAENPTVTRWTCRKYDYYDLNTIF